MIVEKIKIIKYLEIIEINIRFEFLDSECITIKNFCDGYKRKSKINYELSEYCTKMTIKAELPKDFTQEDLENYCTNPTYQMMGIDDENVAVDFLSRLYLKYF